MRLAFRLKHHFFSAFREIFVHHHGSLEFRAKIFALIIAANEKAKVESYIIVKTAALKIYNGNEERANLLMLSTKELVKKVTDDNGLNLDTLVVNIQKELKIVPRTDTISYQENILEFLQNLKDETLSTKKDQIVEDEEKLLQESNNK